MKRNTTTTHAGRNILRASLKRMAEYAEGYTGCEPWPVGDSAGDEFYRLAAILDQLIIDAYPKGQVFSHTVRVQQDLHCTAPKCKGAVAWTGQDRTCQDNFGAEFLMKCLKCKAMWWV